ncbi:MAG: PAS domain S-box protein [Akkermansiaceae bacterium]|nr:PAS domain S-box protein [Verrucomicrobiales bacterium]
MNSERTIRLIALAFWLAAGALCPVQGAGPVVSSLPLQSIGSLGRSSVSNQLSPVRLRGTVVDQRAGEYIVISDNTGTLFVDSHLAVMPKVKEVVDIVGTPVWEGSHFRLKEATIQVETVDRVAGAAESQAIRPDPLPLLTKAWQVRDLSPEQAAWKYPVHLRGVVTYFSRGWRLCLQDDISGITVILRAPMTNVAVGDLVEIQGVSDPGSFAPVVTTSNIVTIGKARMPEPRQVTIYQLNNDQEGSQWVELAGVVHSEVYTNGSLRLILSDPTGRIPVVVEGAVSNAPSLLDSVVRIRGVSSTTFNNRRQFLGPTIISPSLAFVLVEEPAVASPFELPTRSILSLTQFRPRLTLERRVNVSGVVTLCQPGEWFYLQDATDGVQVFTDQTEGVLPGARVKVAGYPALGSFGTVVRDALCRVESQGPTPPPEILNESKPVDTRLHGRWVQVQARLLDRNQVGHLEVLKLQFGNRIVEVSCLAAAADRSSSTVRVGSLVRLTGVYTVLADESKTPVSFQMLAPSAAQIELLAAPPRWTSRHTMVSIGVMGTAIACISLWVMMLRRRVREQTASLQNSEMKFRSLVEQSLIGVYIIQDGRFAYANPRQGEIFGYPSEELLQLTVESIVAPEDRGIVSEQIRQRVEGQVITAHYSFRGIRKDGSRVNVEVLGSRTEYNGRPAVLGTCLDITARKRAEEELFNSRQMLRSVLDTIPQRVFWKSHDSRFAGGNKAFAADCGFADPSDLIGKSDLDIHTPEAVAAYEAEDREVMTTGKARLNYGVSNWKADGSQQWLRVSKVPLFDKNGNVTGVLGTYEDITDRKAAEAALEEASRLLETLLANSPDYIYFKDRDSRFVRASQSLAALFHVESPGELTGKTDLDYFLSEHATDALADEQKIIHSGLAMIGKPEREEHPDGRVTWALTTKLPWRDKSGNIIGTFGISKDVTALKNAENQLAYEKGLLSALVDNLPDAIYFKDRESRFVRMSRSKSERARQTLIKAFRTEHTDAELPPYLLDPALCAEYLVGKTDFDIDSQVRARSAFEEEQLILRTGQPLIGHIEKYIHAEDGRVSWFHATKMPWRDENGNVIGTFGVTRDITPLKEAEMVLDYERELFRTLLEHFPDSIYFKDLESRFVRVSRSEVEGAHQTCRCKYELEHPAGPLPEHLSAAENFGRFLIGKTDFAIYSQERAQSAFDDEQAIIRTGKPLIAKVEHHSGVDGKIAWCISTKIPWRNKEGQIIGTFGVSKDITALKEAEAQLETAHQRLLETSRLAGMAEVATDVLHNVGNVLNSVNISCSLTIDRVRTSKMASLAKVSTLLQENHGRLGEFFTCDVRGQQLPDYLKALAEHLRGDQTLLLTELEQLLKHIDHIKQIVAMQQSYAKVAGVKELITANQLMEDALHINAAALVRHDVHVKRVFSETPTISTEKHKVLQILVNLIRNAKYAMDDAKRQHKLLTLVIATEGDHVKIEVIDNGIGIPAENLTRIFRHGFTTRKNGHGFGLHSSALAVKELGGSLEVHSDGTGTGAKFTLLLPLTPANPMEQKRYEPAAI